MAIRSTGVKTNNTINFGNAEEKQKKKGNGGRALGTAVVLGTGVGGVTYLIAKKQPTAADVFANPGKYLGSLSAQEQKVVKPILETQANLPKTVEGEVKNAFKIAGIFGQKKELKVNNYLHKAKGPEAYKKVIDTFIKRQGEKGAKSIGNVFAEVVNLKNIFRGNFVLFQPKTWRATAIERMQNKLQFVQGAQNGKITREAFKNNVAKVLSAGNAKKMDEFLKKVGGKLPTMRNGQTALVAGLIAAVVGFIGAKVLGRPPKEQPVIAQEMPETYEEQAPETVPESEPASEIADASEAPMAPEEPATEAAAVPEEAPAPEQTEEKAA